MRNKMSDVRDHLVAMMERLGDDSASPDEMERNIQRAKALADVTREYTGTIKVELQAREQLGGRMADLPAPLQIGVSS